MIHLVSSAEIGLDFQLTTMQTVRMLKRASQRLVSAATLDLLFLAAAAEAARWSHGDALGSNGKVRNPSSIPLATPLATSQLQKSSCRTGIYVGLDLCISLCNGDPASACDMYRAAVKVVFSTGAVRSCNERTKPHEVLYNATYAPLCPRSVARVCALF